MINETSWTCHEYAPGFLDACRQAAADPEQFARFRQVPSICAVIETRPNEWTQQFMDAVVASDAVLLDKALEVARINDLIGSPNTSLWKEHAIAGTTASYLHHLAMCRFMFGPLEHLHIGEIGGGYGGFAAVMANYESPASYTIWDLPDVLALQRRFLSTACPAFGFAFDADATPRDLDLLVSCCALSELTDEGMETYGPLCRLATRGLLTWSVTPYSIPWCSDQKIVIEKLERLTNGKQVTCALDSPKFVAKFQHWAPYVYLWGPTE